MFHGSFNGVTYRRDLALKRLHGSISRLAKTLVEIDKLEAYHECNAYSICATLTRLCTCNSKLRMKTAHARSVDCNAYQILIYIPYATIRACNCSRYHAFLTECGFVLLIYS